MLLIDADIVAMRFACKHETLYEFPDNEFTQLDDPPGIVTKFTVEAEREANGFIEMLVTQLGFSDYRLCFTGKKNWRKQIFPSYKHNRKGKWIPSLREHLTEFLISSHPHLRVAELEADDLMGILQTEANQRNEPSVIATIDKDLLQIPGWNYNWNKGGKPVYVTPEQGRYMHWYQTLKGDPTDGYSGCPRCGDKHAKEILLPFQSGKHTDSAWSVIVKAYESRGQTEEDALANARMAYILQSGDFRFGQEKREVKLWHPSRTIWKEVSI